MSDGGDHGSGGGGGSAAVVTATLDSAREADPGVTMMHGLSVERVQPKTKVGKGMLAYGASRHCLILPQPPLGRISLRCWKKRLPCVLRRFAPILFPFFFLLSFFLLPFPFLL